MTGAAASEQFDVAIVGAGIIGIAVAAYLSESGQRVIVIDPDGICAGTSSGNAAAFAFSDVLPLAQKGMIRNLPRWLADPLGPLTIRPSYLPKLAPWLWRFVRAGAKRHYETSLASQASLMRLAESEWMGLLDRADAQSHLREDGSLELYDSGASFAASLPGWAARERFGIGFRHVRGDDLASLQPGLSPQFVGGTFVPGWKTVSDPKHLAEAIWAHAVRHGAVHRKARVTGVEPSKDGVSVNLESGGSVAANKLVVAAGAFSNRILRLLGDRVPLDTERGYNTTLPLGAFDVKRQLIFSDHGFVVTPLATGLRVGGAVEFAGVDAPPNFARSKAMLTKAARFLPGLRIEGGREWMGFRPSLPDSMPVIGQGRYPNLFYAFGHGHLGLTQAAATGRLIRDLVLGHRPAIDIDPFRPNRF